MAFPDAPVVDNFNRDAEDPANGWTTWQGSGISVGNNNTASTSGSSGDNGAYYSAGGDYGPDVEVRMELVDTSGGDFMELQFRLADFGSGGDGYAVGYSKGAGQIDIYRIDNGSYSVIAPGPISQTISDGDSLAATIIGDTITIYYKVGAGAWTNKGTRTDGTYTAAGKVGMNINAGTLQADNFAVVTLASASLSIAAASGSYAATGTASVLRPGSTAYLRYRK